MELRCSVLVPRSLVLFPDSSSHSLDSLETCTAAGNVFLTGLDYLAGAAAWTLVPS